MDREKKNSSLRYMLVLALLLCLGFAVIATGTAFGRYRTSSEGSAAFEVRGTESIYLGTISEDEGGNKVFSPLSEDDELSWTDQGGKKAILKIAVSNAEQETGETKVNPVFPENDLRIKIRLISDLGLTTGTEKDDSGKNVPVSAEVKMTAVPKGALEGSTVTAAAERIQNGSKLFYSGGDGWVYSFHEDGKEMLWDLKGGEFSYLELTIEVDVSKIAEGSWRLSPQIIIEPNN